MKFYFQTKSDEICYNKQYFINLMKENDLKEIEVYTAVKYRIEDMFWCGELEFILENENSMCGKTCEKYYPKNGKNGCCKFHKKTLYEPKSKIKLCLKN